MGKHKKYTKELKTNVVKKYLNGEGTQQSLADEFGIADKNRVRIWVNQYKAGNTEFIDLRGKKSTGRPRNVKDKSQMTKDEYIEYLELENKILKKFAEMMDE